MASIAFIRRVPKLFKYKTEPHFLKRTFYLYTPEPFHPIPDRHPEWKRAEEAVKVIKSGDKIYIHGAAATPLRLVNCLTKHSLENNLENIEVIHIHTEGPAEFTKPAFEGIIRSNSLFIASNVRQAINEGRADCTPIFLSEIPLLFRRKIVNLDVALISVTLPDEHGYCSLGTSVDCTRAAIENAKYIIALANHNMPRTFGDGLIHQSHIDAMVEEKYVPIPERPQKSLSDAEIEIGRLIAENLVSDGATLQMGIGTIPDAVLCQLFNHRDLGVHTEMFSDGVVDLVDRGAITNAKKVVQTGKIVSSFAVGSKKLYNFMDNNPFVVMSDVSFTNSTAIISQNPKVTAINSCIMVDITGQVVSDSIGTRMYSGVGGQIDFIRGAALGLDGHGKPIIAMPSTTKKGDSKIVPFITEGSGVTTTRAHVHYIVTEFGIASLFGKTLRQRAYELIKIAHPNHRESLEKSAFERLKCMPAP
ncbi:4-hydroxybutyrate coenzyme A transferase isoform X2 [Patella vulgata]|uniref:4-hydroxybutyrate coenzyme A transferase isoform X2 n=1 Tax=Patella vulgata TaxID=6465 RepID=UPI0024A9B138|nr:4-hydroxybutyrate coenzyme A transferase isoform X2 [Patella vulgata]